MALLTIPQFREHVTTSLVDAAVQRLLDFAEESIDALAGPVGAVTELRNGGGSFIFLARRASAFTSVKETWQTTTTTLAANDYQLMSDGRTIRRRDTGANPSLYWVGRVEVVYTAAADTATRRMIQLQLVKLEIAFNPALASQTLGDWKEDYLSGKPYEEQREDILAGLTPAQWAFA